MKTHDGSHNVARDLDNGAFSIEGFCAWAGIGRTAAYEEIKCGRLTAKKRGARTLIPRHAARNWLNNLPPIVSA